MKIINNPPRTEWPQVLKRPSHSFEVIEERVSIVLSDVKDNKDMALRKYSVLFDQVELLNFKVSEDEVKASRSEVPAELKKAIKVAASNIEKFHRSEFSINKNKCETTEGVFCWSKVVPINKVGLYIPGGSAPLFSTVLMLGIPAMIAGCEEIILCTPPGKGGKIDPAILFTADLIGIKNIFKIGGAQAIAAMAYGTETVPQVYKIVGPGNQYVTVAKQLIQKDGVAIDMPAGPSEVAVIAVKDCVPEFVAADLLSQAEHGADSQVLLVTDDLGIAKAILTELSIQLMLLPRHDIAAAALDNSKCIIVDDLDKAIEIVNEYAPEHLIIASAQPINVADKITNAGSIFLGNYSPESAGDYASGTNHTLPTNGFARAYSGLSVDHFVKKITLQQITETGIRNIGPVIETMAEAEGLEAHKNAISVRLEKIMSSEMIN